MLDTAYHNARCRISTLVAGLAADQLRTPVPATPEWTVQDVLAHMVGGAAGDDSGVDAPGSEQWTLRQVGQRRGHSVPQLLAEWDHVGPAVEAGLAGRKMTGPNLAADIICHEADLHEALGLGRVDREHWQPFLEVMMRFVRGRLRTSTALSIHDDLGQQWNCGSGEPATVVRADGYELLRASFSRRSRNQIAAWDWIPAPDPTVVERFGCFGGRDDDQPVPGGIARG